MTKPLKVCLDARISSGVGGVEQFIIGLASGFARLTDGDEEYFFLTYEGQDEWLRPHLSGSCKALTIRKPLEARVKARVKKWIPFLPLLLRFKPPVIPVSDGAIERAGIEVMHFTTPNGFLTPVASIYQPHDLQHLHHPAYFSAAEIRRRETVYRRYCEQAELVVMMSQWGRKDLVERYGLSPQKVRVVSGAAVLPAYEINSISDDLGDLDLPEHFLLYPAQTWPHKNHLGLLDGLAMIRDQFGRRIPLVCCGKLNDFYPTIRARVDELGLASQVRFLGFVPPERVKALYERCTAVVFPSLFEGWGMPVIEALWAGAPIVCSNVTSLPDLLGNAGLLFEPTDSEDMVRSILSIWEDEALRKRLATLGRERSEDFGWEASARRFRALYRQIGGRRLDELDQQLIMSGPAV